MNIRTRETRAETIPSWVPERGRSGIGWLAATLLLALTATQPARAACDPRDLADAVVVSLETTSVCEPVCEDKYRCYAAAILGGALTVVANREGQERVDLFCNTAQGTANEVISQVQEVLQYQFVQDQLGEISGYLSSYAQSAQQVIAIVKCACATERLNIKNQTSFGACANEMLHGVGCGSIDFTTGVIESCTPGGKLIQDFFNASWGGLKSIGCDSNLTSWLFDCGVGGTAGPRTTRCYAGYQSDLNGVCRPCAQTTHGITLANGRCGCEAAYTQHYTIRSDIPILVACTCSAPYQQVGDRCLCPPNMMIEGADCVPCADSQKYVPLQQVNGVEQLPTCQSCPLGYRQSKSDPTQCEPGWACDLKSGEVPNPDTYGKTCIKCRDWQRIVADMPIYTHRCENCAKGQKASPDHTRCIAECPAGSITNTAVSSVVLGKAPSACVQCAPGEHAVYDRPGSSIGNCVPMSNASAPSPRKDCATVGANFINDPDNPARCLSCPDGKQPDETRSTCIDRRRAPSGEQRLNDAIRQREPPIGIRQDLQPGSTTPARKCPPNTQPDSRGTGCVPLTTRIKPDD